MRNIFDVANYFLTCQDEDCEDFISNFKLQTLCYYAQSYHLAQTRTRFFDNDIVATPNGVIIKELHDKYNGQYPLSVDEDFDFNKLSWDDSDFLSFIYGYYGKYAPWKLKEMIRDELPWIKAQETKNKIISDKDMITYFKI